MRFRLRPLSTLALTALILHTAALEATAQEESKPLLSEEIRRVLEADGPGAAQRRFDEIFPDEADRYQIDMQAFGKLASGRMQAGDLESAQVLYGMLSTLGQAQAAELMPEVAAAAAAQKEADREAAEASPTPQGPPPELGPARDDLERFAGDYGEPDKQGPGARNLYVGWTCDGYLFMGASWGDAVPWALKSVGETKFEHSGPYRSFTVEFEVDESGQPIALTHDMEDLELPSRLESVPPPWEPECRLVERRGD